MAVGVFADKNQLPSEEDITRVLGQTRPFWDEIRNYAAEKYPPHTEEWKIYGKNSSWGLKTYQKKRNLFFLYPAEGYFTVVFVYGEKAVEEALNAGLPEKLVSQIKEAKVYMEGRGFRVEVREASDVTVVRQLIDIKVRN